MISHRVIRHKQAAAVAPTIDPGQTGPLCIDAGRGILFTGTGFQSGAVVVLNGQTLTSVTVAPDGTIIQGYYAAFTGETPGYKDVPLTVTNPDGGFASGTYAAYFQSCLI